MEAGKEASGGKEGEKAVLGRNCFQSLVGQLHISLSKDRCSKEGSWAWLILVKIHTIQNKIKTHPRVPPGVTGVSEKLLVEDWRVKLNSMTEEFLDSPGNCKSLKNPEKHLASKAVWICSKRITTQLQLHQSSETIVLHLFYFHLSWKCCKQHNERKKRSRKSSDEAVKKVNFLLLYP